MKTSVLKKILAVTVAVVLLFTVPVCSENAYIGMIGASAADIVTDGTCGEDLVWSIDSDGVLTISGSGFMDNYSASEPSPWSDSTADIKSIVVSDGVKSVGEWAFGKCRFAESIYLGNDVETIGDYAFYNDPIKNNKVLTELVIPSNVKTIGNYSFRNFRAMERLTLENGIETIGDYAFDCSYALKELVIPDSVRVLGTDSFSWAKSLKKIIIGTSLEKIDKDTFKNCAELETIYIPENVGVIFVSAFSGCGDFVIHVDDENSYAAKFAGTNDYTYFKHDCELTEVMPPDCMNVGINFYKCQGCGYGYTEIIPTSDHPYGEWVTVVESTCNNGGTKKRVCRVCGSEQTMETEKLGHIYSEDWTVDKKATLTADGSKSHHCINCGEKAEKTAISAASKITLSKTSYTYNGKAVKPTVTVEDSNGQKISADNYTVTYSSGRKNVGKYTVTVKFKNSYSGSKTLDFTIAPKAPTDIKASSNTTSSFKLSWGKVTGAASYKVYYSKDSKTWKTVTSKTNSVTVAKLSAGTTYKVKVVALDSSGKIKSAESTVLTTATKCVAPTVTVKSSAKKNATVSWKKVTGATGYTVYYSTSKDGKYTKLATVTGTSYTNKKLTSGKTYYFKVVANKKVNSKTTLTSAYSTVKSVKVK